METENMMDSEMGTERDLETGTERDLETGLVRRKN